MNKLPPTNKVSPVHSLNLFDRLVDSQKVQVGDPRLIMYVLAWNAPHKNRTKSNRISCVREEFECLSTAKLASVQGIHL